MLADQLTDSIEVVVLRNRGRRSIGEYRQALIEDAAGEYVCFVDDDDRLPPYYCSEILAALKQKPDYVGFVVEMWDLSKKPLHHSFRRYRAIHSTRYDKWSQNNDALYRHVSHLNPVRRELALCAAFEGHRAEDHRWADQIVKLVRSEVFIDRPMYLYDFDRWGSIRTGGKPDTVTKVAKFDLPAGFRYHPQSED